MARGTDAPPETAINAAGMLLRLRLFVLALLALSASVWGAAGSRVGAVDLAPRVIALAAPSLDDDDTADDATGSVDRDNPEDDDDVDTAALDDDDDDDDDDGSPDPLHAAPAGTARRLAMGTSCGPGRSAPSGEPTRVTTKPGLPRGPPA